MTPLFEHIDGNQFKLITENINNLNGKFVVVGYEAQQLDEKYYEDDRYDLPDDWYYNPDMLNLYTNRVKYLEFLHSWNDYGDYIYPVNSKMMEEFIGSVKEWSKDSGIVNFKFFNSTSPTGWMIDRILLFSNFKDAKICRNDLNEINSELEFHILDIDDFSKKFKVYNLS